MSYDMSDAWADAEEAVREWGVSGVRLIGPYPGAQYDAQPWSIHGIRGQEWPVGIGEDPREALMRLEEQLRIRIRDEDWPAHPVSGDRMRE